MRTSGYLALAVLLAFACSDAKKESTQGTGGSTTPSAGGSVDAGGGDKGGATGTTAGRADAALATGGRAATGGSAGISSGTAGRATGGRATGGATAIDAGGRGGSPPLGTGGRAADGRGGSAADGAGGKPDAATSDAPGGAIGGTPGTGGRGTGGAIGQGGATAIDGGSAWNAGNPYGSCSMGIPAKGQPADVSRPTTVVGNGTPDSCDFAQLEAAVAKGGVITFNCGPGPVTIPVTATLEFPSNKSSVLDGGGRITLDGGGAVQIMRFYSANFNANDNGLTLQHIRLINGKTTPTEQIPTRPAPCSQGWNDGEGGALFMRDGYLTIIDSIFVNNRAAPLGPDTGGGAIYVLGSKGGVLIVGSTFTDNAGSNAGAVGCLFAELNVYDSLLRGNQATGHDANNNDPSKCDYINNDQNEIGSGGNGGALYSDGNSKNITLCGNAILDNAAGDNAFGGGLFFTSNDFGGTLTIADTTMTGNTGGYWTQVESGSVSSAGSAVGTNCKSITITNSTLQGIR